MASFPEMLDGALYVLKTHRNGRDGTRRSKVDYIRVNAVTGTQQSITKRRQTVINEINSARKFSEKYDMPTTRDKDTSGRNYMNFLFFAVRVYEVRTHSLSASVCSTVPCLIS